MKDEQAQTQAYVYFTVFGGMLSPNYLSEVINIKATQSALKGDRSSYGPVKETYWEYRIDALDAGEGLDQVSEQLADFLEDKENLIHDYLNRHGAAAKCFIVIHTGGRNFGIFLSTRLMGVLSRLGASLEIDGYS